MQKFLLASMLAASCQIALAAPAAPDFSAIRPTLEPISNEDVAKANQVSGLQNCFWVGTVSPTTHNILFPDSGVVYWATQFRLPAGASLELKGEFPHARHISFNSYVNGIPVDRLNDLMINPAAGSTNPFLVGAARDATARDYRVRIVAREWTAGQLLDDASREANTLYVPGNEALHQLYYRVYVADKGRDVQGGVALPEPLLTLADGKQLSGNELCRAITVKEGAINDIRVPAEPLKAMFKRLSSPETPNHPAQNPPSWNAFFNAQLAASTLLIGTPYEALREKQDATRRGGFFSTLDNTYISTYIDNRFGDVLVLHAKAPTTPHTYAGESTMTAGQLRYWSVCKYRSLSDTAVDGCLYDEQVPVDAKGDYTLVVSTAAQRPQNARNECGVAWLDWGSVGDGIGNPHGGILMIRNMLPAADFTQSLFATRKPGDEQRVLGEYFPTSSYSSKAAFEARGCQR